MVKDNVPIPAVAWATRSINCGKFLESTRGTSKDREGSVSLNILDL